MYRVVFLESFNFLKNCLKSTDFLIWKLISIKCSLDFLWRFKTMKTWHFWEKTPCNNGFWSFENLLSFIKPCLSDRSLSNLGFFRKTSFTFRASRKHEHIRFREGLNQELLIFSEAPQTLPEVSSLISKLRFFGPLRASAKEKWSKKAFYGF